jgi:hypothetical protein
VTGLTAVVRDIAGRIATASAALGRRVDIDESVLGERAQHLSLGEPGEWSANRHCRMVRTSDGWMAVNLARESDLELFPAWIGCAPDVDPWPAVLEAACGGQAERLASDAQTLGLAVSRVGAVRAADPRAPLRRMARGGPRLERPPKVVDLSALWAGPLCGAVLADAGAEVLKIESARRPDATRFSTPAFYARLNASKTLLVLDFARQDDLARLHAEILAADVLITSARPRAFEPLGLAPERLFADRPNLVWVAISGYGWTGPEGHKVAFGDDAAAAGGLVRWRGGRPEFVGDAVADPLTGLAAAEAALRGLLGGGGLLVDAALARTAAGAASMGGLREAA